MAKRDAIRLSFCFSVAMLVSTSANGAAAETPTIYRIRLHGAVPVWVGGGEATAELLCKMTEESTESVAFAPMVHLHPVAANVSFRVEGGELTGGAEFSLPLRGEPSFQFRFSARVVKGRLEGTWSSGDRRGILSGAELPVPPTRVGSAADLWLDGGLKAVNKPEKTQYSLLSLNRDDRTATYSNGILDYKSQSDSPRLHGAAIAIVQPVDARWQAEAKLENLETSASTFSASATCQVSTADDRAFVQPGTYTYTLSGKRFGPLVFGQCESRLKSEEWDCPFAGYVGNSRKSMTETTSSLTRLPPPSDWAVDPVLAAEAVEQSLRPLPHGIPGQTSFQLEVAAYWPRKPKKVYVPASEFWNERMVRGGSGTLQAICAPAFDFSAMPDARGYTFRATNKNGRTEYARFDAEQPWASLQSIWKKLPFETEIYITLAPHGIDPAEGQTRVVYKKSPFPGYRIKRPADLEKRLLRYLEWVERHPFWGGFCSDLSASRMLYPTTKSSDTPSHLAFAVIRSMTQLARFRGDTAEGAGSLRRAERAGEWLLRNHRGALGTPQTQKNWWNGVCWAGLAYLDLYEATGNPRWSRAANHIVQAFAETQQESGTWVWTNPDGVVAGIPDGHHHGVQMREFDPSEFLYLFGRARVLMQTSMYRENERRALEWIRCNSAASFHWRSQFSHNELGGGTASAKSALFFVRYLLDYAPQADRDLALVDELLRYSEDQYVVWNGDGEDGLPTVFMRERSYSGPSATLTAALADAFLRRHQVQPSPLAFAKGQALLAAVLARQGPVSGGISPSLAATPDYCERAWRMNYMYPASALETWLSVGSE